MEFKKRGIDIIAVIAYDSAFVMYDYSSHSLDLVIVIFIITDTDCLYRAAWGKANKVFNQEILFLSDPGAAFSKLIGWSNGIQAARYAIVLDKSVVVYAGKDDRGNFNVRRRLLA